MKIYNRKYWKLLEDNSDIKPMLEVNDIDVDIDSVLRINGELWTVCIITHGGEDIVVKALGVTDLDDDADELYGESNVICPYCGHSEESFELDDFDDEHECPYCGSIFAYQREVTVAYNMQPIRKNTNIQEIN